MTRRILQLLIGLPLFGLGAALMVQAAIGLDPWTVFAQGISLHTGIGIGWVTVVLGFAVLLLWIPLREKPGIGTIANVLIVGTSMQVGVDLLPIPEDLLLKIVFFVGGLLLLAGASGLYIGAHFGAGPRDGLMTGLRSRLGWPIWVARTVVEASVLVIGWMLGGNVGVGTLVFAALIGPLVHVALRFFDVRQRPPAEPEARPQPMPEAQPL